MISVTRPNDLKLHKLTICLAVWHVVGNQKPLKGPSELMLYNNFCLGLNTNLLEVCATWSGIHVTSESTQKGLNIVSKKSDNCVSNTFSKILEKTGRTLTGL